MQALLEKLLPQVPNEETELIRALIQQLGSVGSQQIRNVAVSRAPKKMFIKCFYFHIFFHFGQFLVCWRKHHERVSELRLEPSSGCREEQSHRYIRRFVWKNSAPALKTKNLHQKCDKENTSTSLYFHQVADARSL